MEKNLNILKFGLVGLSLLVVLLFVSDVLSLEFLINYGIGLLGLVVLTTVGAAIFNFIETPEKGKVFLIGFGALVLVYLISYAAADFALDKEGQIIAGSKHAEAGIYTLYVVMFFAVLGLLYSSLKRFIR